jgi:hypothetical protein
MAPSGAPVPRAPAAPFWPTARLVTRTAGLAGALRALPPLAALAIAATVIFAGNGMDAADVVHLLHASPAGAIAVWGAWLFLTAPAARALFETRETFFLRALPVPPWHFWVVHGAHLAALQLAWAVLFARGEGLLAGLAAMALAAAASALAVARPATVREACAAIAVAASILAPIPAWAQLATGLAASTIGIACAWSRAPARGDRHGRSRVAGGPFRALVLAHAVVLARRDAVTLVRGLFAAIAGAAVLALLIRNNGPDARGHEAELTLLAGAFPLSLATGGVAARVLVTELRLEWLLLTTGASARLRAIAAVSVPAIWGIGTGAVLGLPGAVIAGLGAKESLQLAGLAAAIGGSLGISAAYWSRRAELGGEVDGTRLVVGMIASAAVVMILAAWVAGYAVIPLVAAAIALAVASIRYLEVRDRRRDPSHRPAWGIG